MKIPAIILSIFLLSTTGVFSQSFTKELNKKIINAEDLYSNDKFASALPIFLDIVKFDSLNSDLNYKIGICYLNSRTEKIKSIHFLEKAIECTNNKQCTEKENKARINAFKSLGDAFHLAYKFDQAIVAYEKYKSMLPNNKDQTTIEEVNRKIEMCKVGKELIATPVKIEIENMGAAINSAYADYGPVLSADESTLIFTSRRPESTGGKTDEDGKFFEDIYISKKTDSVWLPAVSIGTSINTDGNEATVGISVDGQIILIYKDEKGNGNLFTTSLIGDEWSSPKKLNKNINTKGWEPSAFLSADGNILYFTSNRKGGFGGRDIYKSNKLPNGEWAVASNLGPVINTSYDEDAPFIHPDGVTLYFSSNGQRTMGGFDIFSSMLTDKNEWTKPANIGYPINSTDDDIYYAVSADNKRAYYSSFKGGGIGEKDNYLITFFEYVESPLTLLKGLVTDPYEKVPKAVEITVTDNETGKIAGIYHPNSKTGEYLFILPPGKNYNITYEAEGYLFHSENMDVLIKTNYYVIRKAVQLKPLVVGAKVVLKNIFFDFDEATLRPISNVELGKLFKLLSSNKGMIVEISGHTDEKGELNYNLKLSEERAQSVVDYLIEKGINKNQMIAKGYGESNPIADNFNSDGIENTENMQLNRRVELKIIEIKSVKK
ncbi:MAG: OmpA family protein [Bacteroidetes bacterium]|nr:OmpA family protein [Bacteroidota bacterium]